MANGKRAYSPIEKMGLMWAASTDGVPTTSATHNVPESTLYQWFDDVGGIGAVRNFYEELTRSSYARSLRAVFDEVAARAPKMTTQELGQNFRALVAERSDTQQVAQAVAAVSINVNLNE